VDENGKDISDGSGGQAHFSVFGSPANHATGIPLVEKKLWCLADDIKLVSFAEHRVFKPTLKRVDIVGLNAHVMLKTLGDPHAFGVEYQDANGLVHNKFQSLPESKYREWRKEVNF
jgi:hypothetical protein